jgi:hypothetical protein
MGGRENLRTKRRQNDLRSIGVPCRRMIPSDFELATELSAHPRQLARRPVIRRAAFRFEHRDEIADPTIADPPQSFC